MWSIVERMCVHMAQFIGTFERKETKYVLSEGQIALMKAGLAGLLKLDDYGATRIDSLYFDTPNRDIIARSLEKPIYKEKLRVRAYGDANPESPVFVELKKKFKGIVYKRRMRMSRRGAEAYFSGMPYEQAQRLFPVGGTSDESAFDTTNIQIAREIDMFRNRYQQLKPSMLISCVREAWKAVDPNNPDTDIRITFDERISYVDVSHEAFDYSCAVAREDQTFALAPGRAVMEIKCAGAYPLWLVELLDRCGIRPQSFSKYGTAYTIVSSMEARKRTIAMRQHRPLPTPASLRTPTRTRTRRSRAAIAFSAFFRRKPASAAL